MKLRRKIAAGAIALAAVAGTAGVAEAHSFGASGPPHTHTSCLMAGGTSGQRCYRWILENGAIRQGSADSFAGELPLVGVLCSTAQTSTYPPQNGNWGENWAVNNVVIGEWGSNGFHTYCQNPKYPTPYGLAGWSLNY